MPVINSSRLVIFEGADNCGKTTLVQEVGRLIKQDGYNVRLMSQPRSCALGEEIYKLHHQYSFATGFALQLLNVACHIQSYTEDVKNQNSYSQQITLSDRSFLSSMAYGFAYPGAPEDADWEVRAIFDLETFKMSKHKSLIPTHIFFLSNLPHEKADEVNENFDKVRAGYNKVLTLDYLKAWCSSHGIQRYAIDNAPGKLEETAQLVYKLIQS